MTQQSASFCLASKFKFQKTVETWNSCHFVIWRTKLINWIINCLILIEFGTVFIESYQLCTYFVWQKASSYPRFRSLFSSEILNALQISPKISQSWHLNFFTPPTPVEAPQLQAFIPHSNAKYFFRQIALQRCCQIWRKINLSVSILAQFQLTFKFLYRLIPHHQHRSKLHNYKLPLLIRASHLHNNFLCLDQLLLPRRIPVRCHVTI